MTPTGSARGRSRVMPYGMDAFMLGIGMLGKIRKLHPLIIIKEGGGSSPVSTGKDLEVNGEVTA
ncbi:RNA-binding protein Musashi 1 [Liparis tanakae]|uniref:RNA-binding protein Musashi 1 n=1 Tax=Liparis tanakae TaxID=230148 RepID=A0A4Z2FMG1_9TELE|nr:RNA-binding protein Musashi 1 [Liparis tanakae]